ncbi:hypothetical protein ACFQY4_18785 [Catellatospora bangladeshensis]|uniref:Uncharacterized protein n=1 Tax=Catellatospora bangladeshensis TaxID=310355 RepID=A0A8J3JCR7_9ACTN|nr:hypothetical protein [Catellatospora bangladeshensis]GIF81951.1 hypothetical protein Cba03nite_33000 [Catellatospora bangladeshensis]
MTNDLNRLRDAYAALDSGPGGTRYRVVREPSQGHGDGPGAPRPVVAGFDPDRPAPAALSLAADQAAAQQAPLHVLVASSLPVWTHHLAMAPCPPAAFSDEPAAQQARDAVAQIREDHPGTDVTVYGTSRSLPRALLRQTGAASIVVTDRDPDRPRQATRLSGTAACPVFTVPTAPAAPSGAPVLIVGIDGPGDAAEFAMLQAQRRRVPVLSCDLNPAAGGFTDAVALAADRHPTVDVHDLQQTDLAAVPAGLAVLRRPARRRDAAWPLLTGLLRQAPYPVVTVPAA